MDNLIDKINETVTKLVMNYFDTYEERVSQRISEKNNIDAEAVRKIIHEVIHNPPIVGELAGMANPIYEEATVTSGTVACTGKTKAGKQCKYKCINGKDVCNKHLKEMNHVSCHTQPSPISTEQARTDNILSTLPPDEASWFNTCITNNHPTYKTAFYPTVSESGLTIDE